MTLPQAGSTCLYLACPKPATHVIRTPGGDPSPWCQKHGKAAFGIYGKFDKEGSVGTTMTTLGTYLDAQERARSRAATPTTRGRR